MSTKAYILIETTVGKSRDVADALRSLQGVETVDAVTGPYDIISIVTASDLNHCGGVDHRRASAAQKCTACHGHRASGFPTHRDKVRIPKHQSSRMVQRFDGPHLAVIGDDLKFQKRVGRQC